MVRPSNLPLWFAAVFAAGGALGAVGVASVRTSAPVADVGQAAKGPRGQVPETQGPAPDDPVIPVDRDALRAVLTELLEEEGRSAPQRDDSHQAGEIEGISAADALARLEAAYRAELEAREVEEPTPREVDDTRPPVGEESRQRDHELAGVPVAPEVQPLVEVEEPEAEQAEPELARADSANRDAESGNVRVGSVQVVNGDVNHVDARQTHASQVAVINHYQPVFVQPWFDAAPTQGQPQGQGRARPPSSSGMSPLSKPLPSAHDQSPWSPIDYSRHHNPWGPTFGRPIP